MSQTIYRNLTGKDDLTLEDVENAIKEIKAVRKRVEVRKGLLERILNRWGYYKTSDVSLVIVRENQMRDAHAKAFQNPYLRDFMARKPEMIEELKTKFEANEIRMPLSTHLGIVPGIFDDTV